MKEINIFNKIYDFCKIRNAGNFFHNTEELTPRLKFLVDLLEELNMDFEIDQFSCDGGIGYNLILRGEIGRIVTAHHDVANEKIDNANDNSCSVINAIAIKKRIPEVTVVLLDGEEVGGLGAQRLSEQINSGKFGEIEWILNLELSGKGGRKFFIGNYPGKLSDRIVELFQCPIVNTPFNDSVIFRRNGIDSVVINPLPVLEEGETSHVKFGEEYLDFSLLYNCHSQRDSIDTIDPKDMQEFVEEIVLKILKN
jgi:hypothetical protein